MVIFRTPDHPGVSGQGNIVYPVVFPTEQGFALRIEMGQAGFDQITDLLMDMLTGAPPHSDGSIPGL